MGGPADLGLQGPADLGLHSAVEGAGVLTPQREWPPASDLTPEREVTASSELTPERYSTLVNIEVLARTHLRSASFGFGASLGRPLL